MADISRCIRHFSNTVILMGLGLLVFTTAFAQGFDPDVLTLDGHNGLALAPDPAYDLSKGGTVEFWVQPAWTQDPGFDPVVLCSAGPEGAEYVIAVLRERDGIAIATEDWEQPVAVDLTDGNFHHIAITSMPEGAMVFVDGHHVGSTSGPIRSRSTVALWIGTIDGKDNAFIGEIAAMRFWNTPLSPQTISAYATQDIFTSPEVHPKMAALAAISDFTHNQMLITDQGK